MYVYVCICMYIYICGCVIYVYIYIWGCVICMYMYVYVCIYICMYVCICIPHIQWNIQFNSVSQLCPILCDPMDCSTPGFSVHHQLLELAQTHVHGVGDAIQSSHPLSSPSPPAFSLAQHQGLFQWVSSSHQVAKLLELQLQDQSFQWIFRTDFL